MRNVHDMGFHTLRCSPQARAGLLARCPAGLRLPKPCEQEQGAQGMEEGEQHRPRGSPPTTPPPPPHAHKRDERRGGPLRFSRRRRAHIHTHTHTHTPPHTTLCSPGAAAGAALHPGCRHLQPRAGACRADHRAGGQAAGRVAAAAPARGVPCGGGGAHPSLHAARADGAAQRRRGAADPLRGVSRFRGLAC